jgi:hypothetical protein
MRHLKIYCLFILALLCGAANVSGQQPAYFVLGEEQFRGLQIYDVIQDKKANYWFATNEGLYYYDHYNYQNINIPKAKNKSMFGFVIDKKTGVIYCHDLNKQVFRISGKECTLFYQLKEGEGSADMSLAVADNGDLVVSAKIIIALDSIGNACLRYNAGPGYLSPSYVLSNGEVLICPNNGENVYVYSKGQLTKKAMRSGRGVARSMTLRFFSIGLGCFAIDLSSGKYYGFNTSTFELSMLPSDRQVDGGKVLRMYETKYGAWLAGSLPGVRLSREWPLDDRAVMYKDYFISNVYQDNEGNVLLSTFGKGVLVIPDMNIPDAISTFRDDPVTSVYADHGSRRLLLGTSKGSLLQYSEAGLKILDSSGRRSIEGIYGRPGYSPQLYDNGRLSALMAGDQIVRGTATPSLKGAAVISENEYYIASNLGISHVRLAKGGGLDIEDIPGMNSRAYFIGWEQVSGNVYAYTTDGLFMLARDGRVSQVLYKGRGIVANGIYCADGNTFVSTPSDGIFLVKGVNVGRVIHPYVNGHQEEIRKLAIYKNTIIGQSRNGLFQFDIDGRLLRSLHVDHRFPENRVVDLCFNEDTLWVCHSGGVQKVNMAYRSVISAPPVIRMDSMRVNDSYVSTLGSGDFGSSSRKFEFIISSPTLRYKEYTIYQYRLLGYDSEWKVSNYKHNRITYNALAPGDYKLEVKANTQGKSSPTLSYSFSISSPFYLRWYFIATCMAAFILLVFFIYKRQLNIQRKRSQQINELNASKLTAIRSQMNPHFIFNSLNSIQDLILKGDVERSYSYITTFSDLIRRSLNYSEKELIDFEQELKLLELYLSLEKLRFKKDLSYEVETNGISDILVPPMLIQPFIENAIAHGLLHKEGDKTLKITFTLGEALICRIEDNGIGREKAMAILKRQRAGHESFSGAAIKRRFDILSAVFGGKFGYVYEDKADGAGTVVVLTIPAIPRY